MDNELMISIIVPVYNVERYLRECIDSVLVQTHTKWELILVNDGSTDSSGAICDEYALKDQRIRVIHKENEGVSKARNTGLDAAIGQYIVFIDSDDYVECNMLHDYCVAAVENEIDCVVSGLVFLDDETKNENPIVINRQCIDFSRDINNVFSEFRNKHVFSSIYSKMYKKSIIDESRIRLSEEHSILEDGMFVIDYFMVCRRIYCMNSTPYFYRQYREISLMKRYNKNALSAWESYYKKFGGLSSLLSEENKDEMRDIVITYYFSFMHQIYSRSFLSEKGKYGVLREYLDKANELKLFEHRKMPRRIQEKLVISLAKLRLYFLIHLLFGIKHHQK